MCKTNGIACEGRRGGPKPGAEIAPCGSDVDVDGIDGAPWGRGRVDPPRGGRVGRCPGCLGRLVDTPSTRGGKRVGTGGRPMADCAGLGGTGGHVSRPAVPRVVGTDFGRPACVVRLGCVAEGQRLGPRLGRGGHALLHTARGGLGTASWSRMDRVWRLAGERTGARHRWKGARGGHAKPTPRPPGGGLAVQLGPNPPGHSQGFGT